MSKILFINPNLRQEYGLLTVYPPLGLLSIASVLLDNKYDLAVLDADIDNQTFQDIEDKIHTFQPELIGITMTTLQCKSVLTLADYIKRKFPSVIIVVGGVHPSALRSELLKQSPAIDIVIFGEGEQTFLDLVRTIDNHDSLDKVNGICYRRDDGAIQTTKPRELIEDLDILPFPAFDLVSPLSKYPGPYPVKSRPTIHIMASRGCPFGCQFCSNPIWGKKVRFHSPEYILMEIEWLQKSYNVQEIFFQDDTFNLTHRWLEKICQGIISRGLNKKCVFKAPFRANASLVSPEILKLLKKAGFWMIFYGVESGDPEVLRAISKNLTLDEIKRAFYLTKKAGIQTYASFMIGNLNDSPSSIKNSIKFAKIIDPDYVGFAVAMPYPGSRLYEILEENDQITLSDTMNFKMGKYIIPNTSFQPGEVERFSQRAFDEITAFKNSWHHKLLYYLQNHDFPQTPDRYFDYRPFDRSHLPDHLNSCIEMGSSDNYHLEKGWYPFEFWPPSIRWTQSSATLFLRPNKDDKTLKIKIVASKPYGDQILMISIDGDTCTVPVDHKNPGIITLPLKKGIYLKKFIKIVITTTPTWVPDCTLHNGDRRTLGVAINKIWTD